MPTEQHHDKGSQQSGDFNGAAGRTQIGFAGCQGATFTGGQGAIKNTMARNEQAADFQKRRLGDAAFGG